MEREIVTSGTDREDEVGYARAVRAGGEVHVSGTTDTDEDGDAVAPGEPEAQTRQAIRNVERALEGAGATLEDVVRTRIFVTDIDDWAAVGAAHREAFGDVRPATTMVQVERHIDPELVVELEAIAVVANSFDGE